MSVPTVLSTGNAGISWNTGVKPVINHTGGASFDNPYVFTGVIAATDGTTATAYVSYGNVNLGKVDGIMAARAVPDIQNHESWATDVHLYVANHAGVNTHHWLVKAVSTRLPYTSTLATNKDDGVDLIQTNGNTLTSLPNASLLGTAPGKGGAASITNYIRPTTVAIKGANTFQNINFINVGWWYRWHEMARDGSNNYFTQSGHVQYEDLRGGCGHIPAGPP